MSVTSATTVYARTDLLEIEYRGIRLNGAAVPLGRDAVPRLPIIEPERVAATPLALLLDHRYRYRLGDPEPVDGHPCYVVVFEPAVAGIALLEGRAWISAEDFGLVRLDATQTGLRGPIVASRQRDEYRALDLAGERACWSIPTSTTRCRSRGSAISTSTSWAPAPS
jgi:hypothetical protein